MDFLKKFTVVSPNGWTFDFRETNGADEDILGKSITNLNSVLKNQLDFLQNVLLGIKDGLGNTVEITKTNLESLKLCERFWLLIQIRIFSVGPTLEFEWGKDSPIVIEEDLSPLQYGSKGYKAPYNHPHKNESFAILRIGDKNVKYVYFNATCEKKLYAMGDSPNSGILSRFIQIEKEPGEWQEITSLNIFSSKEMAILRKHIKENDPEWSPTSDFEYNGQKFSIPILGIADFFYPAIG